MREPEFNITPRGEEWSSRNLDHEQRSAELAGALALSDPDTLGGERFAAIAEHGGGEHWAVTCESIPDALAYLGDEALDGWDPVGITDLETGETWAVKCVASPRFVIDDDTPQHERQVSDADALEQLAAFMYADPARFPGGADTCEALDQVLQSTGRDPRAYDAGEQ